MAIRQYIGARYVPKFYEGTSGSEWDANVQYEPLTIVTYLNNTYTSKKFVPASVGSPMANPDYWVATGMYNEQLNQVVERVNALEITVGDEDEGLVKDVNDLNTSVGELAESVNGMEEVVGQIDEKIDTKVESAISGFYTLDNRNFIIGSDSYGAPTYGNWAAQLISVLGLQTGQYLNLATPGGAFTATGSEKWITVLQTGTANMTQEDKNAITDIVLFGGINDSRPWSEIGASTESEAYNIIKGAIAEYATYVKTAFPNATITLGFIGNVRDSGDRRVYNLVRNALHAWYDAAGELDNVRFVDNMQYIMHNYEYLQNDNIHPTEAGGHAIAISGANAIKGGQVLVDRGIEGDAYAVLFKDGQTIDSRITHTSYGGKACVRMTNGIITATLGTRWSFEFNNLSTTITVTNGERIKIGESGLGWFQGKPNLIHFPCEVYYYDRSGSDTTAKRFKTTYLDITEGEITLIIDEVAMDYTVTSVVLNQIIVQMPMISYDTMMN